MCPWLHICSGIQGKRVLDPELDAWAYPLNAWHRKPWAQARQQVNKPRSTKLGPQRTCICRPCRDVPHPEAGCNAAGAMVRRAAGMLWTARQPGQPKAARFHKGCCRLCCLLRSRARRAALPLLLFRRGRCRRCIRCCSLLQVRLQLCPLLLVQAGERGHGAQLQQAVDDLVEQPGEREGAKQCRARGELSAGGATPGLAVRPSGAFMRQPLAFVGRHLMPLATTWQACSLVLSAECPGLTHRHQWPPRHRSLPAPRQACLQEVKSQKFTEERRPARHASQAQAASSGAAAWRVLIGWSIEARHRFPESTTPTWACRQRPGKTADMIQAGQTDTHS